MFLLEVNKDTNIHTEEVAVAAELLAQKAWLENKENNEVFKMVDLSELETMQIPEDATPVGSIEFCERVLEYPLATTNVPKGLRDPLYTGRRITDAKPETLAAVFKDFGTDTLFIKSATQCKCDYTGIYKLGDQLPDDIYFVSEVINPIAEWRCFVWNGQIVDIRRYIGDYGQSLSTADLQLIKNMVIAIDAEYNKKMPAYVIDVGKSETRDLPVIIEIHNFIACGLYGFSDKRLLPMLRDGAIAERALRCQSYNEENEAVQPEE
ncbi:MAG: ATP-grasp domain-containing protein [Lachnospiraceae bacterium]|nr:ATP-grasp domain-containing protein [Lachnospiraceae bacterium]